MTKSWSLAPWSLPKAARAADMDSGNGDRVAGLKQAERTGKDICLERVGVKANRRTSVFQ